MLKILNYYYFLCTINYYYISYDDSSLSVNVILWLWILDYAADIVCTQDKFSLDNKAYLILPAANTTPVSQFSICGPTHLPATLPKHLAGYSSLDLPSTPPGSPPGTCKPLTHNDNHFRSYYLAVPSLFWFCK